MNINEFMQFKNLCPACNVKLSLSILGDWELTQDSNYIILAGAVEGWQMSMQSYSFSVHIFIDMDTNEFTVDFPRDREFVPISTIRKFLGKWKNTSYYPKFIMSCPNCESYEYTTTPFYFDFKIAKISSIIMEQKSIIINDTNDCYMVFNNIIENFTRIGIWPRHPYQELIYNDPDFSSEETIKNFYYPITSSSETIKTVKNALTFA